MDNQKKLSYLHQILNEYRVKHQTLESKVDEKRFKKEKLELLLNIVDKGSHRIDLTQESEKIFKEYQEAKKNLQDTMNSVQEEMTVLKSIIENTEEEIYKITNVPTI